MSPAVNQLENSSPDDYCLQPALGVMSMHTPDTRPPLYFTFLLTPFLRGTVVVLPSRYHCSILHLSRLLADTLLPVRHALLDMLINLEDRFYDPYGKQSKHSTVVTSYDVEIVTVGDVGPMELLLSLTCRTCLRIFGTTHALVTSVFLNVAVF